MRSPTGDNSHVAVLSGSVCTLTSHLRELPRLKKSPSAVTRSGSKNYASKLLPSLSFLCSTLVEASSTFYRLFCQEKITHDGIASIPFSAETLESLMTFLLAPESFLFGPKRRDLQKSRKFQPIFRFPNQFEYKLWQQLGSHISATS